MYTRDSRASRIVGGPLRNSPRFTTIKLAVGERANKGESYGMYRVVKMQVPADIPTDEMKGERALADFWARHYRRKESKRPDVVFATVLE